MSRTYRALPEGMKYFRNPHHRQLLAEFFAAQATGQCPFTVDQVIKDGSWADITPSGWSCKNTPPKIQEAKRRRKAARIKLRMQYRALRAWGGHK